MLLHCIFELPLAVLNNVVQYQPYFLSLEPLHHRQTPCGHCLLAHLRHALQPIKEKLLPTLPDLVNFISSG
jgi:hypothetical protein